MRSRWLFVVLMLFSLGARAQDTLRGCRNNVKVGLLPTTLMASPYISYEHTFAKGFSLEVDGYYQSADAKWSYLKPFENVFGTQVAMKYLVAVRLDEWWNMGVIPWIKEIHEHGGVVPTIREMQKNNVQRRRMKREGVLVSGTYLKAGLTYQHKWRTFDCFVGNQGSTIFTEDRTFSGEQMGLNLIIGNQTVYPFGLILDFYGGIHVPVLTTGIGQNSVCPAYIWLLTGGMKIGWAF